MGHPIYGLERRQSYLRAISQTRNYSVRSKEMYQNPQSGSLETQTNIRLCLSGTQIWSISVTPVCWALKLKDLILVTKVRLAQAISDWPFWSTVFPGHDDAQWRCHYLLINWWIDTGPYAVPQSVRDWQGASFVDYVMQMETEICI